MLPASMPIIARYDRPHDRAAFVAMLLAALSSERHSRLNNFQFANIIRVWEKRLKSSSKETVSGAKETVRNCVFHIKRITMPTQKRFALTLKKDTRIIQKRAKKPAERITSTSKESADAKLLMPSEGNASSAVLQIGEDYKLTTFTMAERFIVSLSQTCGNTTSTSNRTRILETIKCCVLTATRLSDTRKKKISMVAKTDFFHRLP